jgi:hypothetical protein
MKTRQQKLIEFAQFTLDILERDLEWDADTIDDIGAKAIQLGLAKNDDDSLFTQTS